MKRVLFAVLLALAAALPAKASPSFEYAFLVDEACRINYSNCDPVAPGVSLGRWYLESFRLVLTQEEVERNSADYLWINETDTDDPYAPPVIDEFSNSGFVSIKLDPYFEYGEGKPPGSCSVYHNGCLLDVGISDISAFLTGAISHEQFDEQLYMRGSGKDWTGELYSDDVSGQFRFTGYWQLVRAIPEPGSLSLILLGLVVIAAAGRRKG